MTHSIISLETTPEDHRIARLAAAAIALSLADSAIPLPLPGIKPGLANIVTLIVLARDGWAQAVSVTALRILASGLLLGHVFSPAFFLSLSGAVASLGVLALVVRLPARVFGPISWSLFAAFAHSAGQLALARLWLIPHDGLFYLVPFFAAAALIFGTLNGLVAAHLLDKTAAPHETRTQNA